MDLSATSLAAPAARRRAPGLPVAIAASVVAISLLVLPACGSNAAATTFRGAAVNTPSADPFTASIGTDQSDVTPPANVTGAYAATTPGLYGGSGSDAVCDPAALVGFLEADPVKAAAWAGVLEIQAAEIGAYVARLTPVVLRADTAFTNHGFAKGKATSTPSVLQAGTAVLVDDRGVPVVKCRSGNPLTAASTDDATYEGAKWDGFRPDAVTTVTPAPAPVASLVLADPTGAGVRRPIGTTGAADTPYVPGGDDPPAPAPDLAADGVPDGASGSDYPVGTPGSDYPLGTPRATTTYVATYQPPGVDDPTAATITDGCRRAGILEQPFTITLRVGDDGVGPGEVTVEGSGSNDGSVALGSPQPSTDLSDTVSPVGTFSAGGRRTYDTSTREGVFTARWSGGLGDSQPRPTELPLTIRQSWARDPEFVAWLTSSGGPAFFSCAYTVVAVQPA
ncbi:MAG: DUF6777 domain-containing protein [Acidimicrobiia bacterium]